MSGPEALLLVAHGSRDPRAPAVAVQVAADVAARVPGLGSSAAFLGLSRPSPAQALDALGPDVAHVTVVPFLLSHAYHSKVDLPQVAELVRSRNRSVRLDPVLGPHPLLLDALVRRLDEATVRTGCDALVLAAAGSTDPEANASVQALADALSERLGVPVGTGFASTAQPTVRDAVIRAYDAGRRNVAVATYLLAPGFFADRVAEEAWAAGAVAVSEPLGTAPEIVRLVVERLQAKGVSRAA